MSHPRHAEPLPLGNEHQPYSKGLMSRALVAVGVPIGRAYELARRIEQDLADRHEEIVELDRFEQLAVEVLGDVDGSRAIDRLRRLHELQELDLPVIVLVGGATGTGKSTVATEAAYRLGITRVTSTDFVPGDVTSYGVTIRFDQAGTSLITAEMEASGVPGTTIVRTPVLVLQP